MSTTHAPGRVPAVDEVKVAEAARLLGRSADRIRTRARLGEFRHAGAYQLTAGGAWRFRRDAFNAWHAQLGQLGQPTTDPYAIEPPSRASLARRGRRHPTSRKDM